MEPEPFAVEITAGHIMSFARSVNETQLLYLDRRAAQAAGFEHVIAPPTFLVVADHFDPNFERRPVPNRPWLGSGRTPSGLEDDATTDAPLHAGQQFDFHRSIVAGETLLARRLPATRWTRTGRRGGQLEFVELVTEFHDQAGLPVARVSWLDVYTERRHSDLSTARSEGLKPDPNDDPTNGTTTVLVENITRTQFVMYAGASGDFHPLHHDDVYARYRGYPGVFAPGMLTMAMAARPLVDAVGPERVLRYEGRWAAQVWPGDSLWATTALTTVHHDEQLVPRADVHVRNQHRELVFRGSMLGRPTNETDAICT